MKRVIRNLKRQKHRKYEKVRLTFQDEAGFGRINKPRYCWCEKGTRPCVPCHHIREYIELYGAVEPKTGDNFFKIYQKCNTLSMTDFLEELSKKYTDDFIFLVCDSAAWHRSKDLKIPKNIRLLSIPPYTPEMNPIEQIWKEIRKIGFRNEIFPSLKKVIERLQNSIQKISNETIKSVTGRDWIVSIN